ncbi:focadhesin [Plodia interpunctella]|uniref:focadhesin n=1 Tax=Plodia interpunctella TaxID=58824 RepID=UPI0023689569|nr:focadhesin [Plodia interpunctella]
MDEIEYKLNTNNSVLIVNAIDKLICTIKSKYKPGERQKFVLENEELKFLREKCSSKNAMVSHTACQGLLALVELGVMDIGQTMSIVVTLLPSAHHHSAIISTMSGLMILDLKSRLVPGQPYKCQFGLKSPQHPFITVLEKNKAEDEVLVQMHALCTHPDYIVSSNSLELLRPVFLWLTCNPRRSGSVRPWQLLLSLPQSTAQSSLLLACLSCQQICNPDLVEQAFAAYSIVTEAALYKQDSDQVEALLPMITRISRELVKHGRDPRQCYSLTSRCADADASAALCCAVLCCAELARALPAAAALHLHELFARALDIIEKYECCNISLNMFVALSLQWLHLPSYLTSSALKVASKIIDIYQSNNKEDNRLHMPNLKANKVFQTLLYTDSKLYVTFKLLETWERVRDNPDKLKSWFDSLDRLDEELKFELLPFLLGVAMDKRNDDWFEDIIVRALRMVVGLVDKKKEASVMLLPVLVYKIANDKSPRVKMECLKALPLMAKTKENVPTIVAILNSLKAGKGAPVSFLISLYTTLAETQVRCFPYLQELLVEPGAGRPDEPKWEVELARAEAVDRICELRPSSHGLELVPTLSSILNAGCAGASVRALHALARLWRARSLAVRGAWRALQRRLLRDARPLLQVSLCRLLSEIPALRVSTPEFDKLISEVTCKLWTYIADSNQPDVVEAACDALAQFKITDYKLKDIPEVYRRSVKLPSSYCKTPADAARKPEDVLDYVPCEVWPEVYKYTNQFALNGIERLCTKLIEREIKGYRSGVYQHDARAEPQSAGYLPASSVARGLLDCFRKQTTSPCYEFPDSVLLSILNTLTAEYPRPLPPVDMCYLHEAIHRGEAWKAGCLMLAARQAQTSASARRLLENYLQGIDPGATEQSDIILVFELLPILCRGVPPNSLRGPIERCLAESYSVIARTKRAHGTEEPLFVKQLNYIRQALESDKIHDANRTLLSQIVEHYFSIISDDNVAWPTYVQTCRTLSTKYLERMTSPTSWWENTVELVRKSTAVRVAVAIESASLVWLNELIDAQSSMVVVHEYSVECMIPALQAADRDAPATVEWFLQLMARTQVAFHETENQSAKQYLCNLVMITTAIFSGHWSLSASPCTSDVTLMLPAATAQLFQREAWQNSTRQMLEWLIHTRDNIGCCSTALSCQRALLATRHTAPFMQHNIWTRLESYFGKHAVEVDM